MRQCKMAQNTDLEQHMLVDFTEDRAILTTINLSGRNVPELGAGNGNLTNLILEQNPASIDSYEIYPAFFRLQKRGFS